MKSVFTQVVTIEQVNNGALSELFQDEFQKVLNNLADEDTSWKVQREVNMKVVVKLTSEERKNAGITVQVTSKTAPTKPSESVVYLDSDGKKVSAYNREEPEQPELNNIRNIEEAK